MYSRTVARAPASEHQYWSTAQQYFDIYLCSSIYVSSTALACSTAADMQHHVTGVEHHNVQHSSTSALRLALQHCMRAAAGTAIIATQQHGSTARVRQLKSTAVQQLGSTCIVCICMYSGTVTSSTGALAMDHSMRLHSSTRDHDICSSGINAYTALYVHVHICAQR